MATRKKENKTKAVILSEREAPIQRQVNNTDIVSSVMAEAQLKVLLAKTPEHAIKTRPGGKGKLLKYVPHGYVTDMLNRAFGFDWDYKLMPYFDNGSVYHMEKVEVGKHQKTGEPIYNRYISVYGELTVRIHNPKKLSEIIATVTKPGPGSAVWYPENEFGDALKAAKSDGLKVAAHELGIALDLYYDDEAERNKYEQEQEERRKRDEEEALEEILNVNAEDVKETSNVPMNGVMLIAQAASQYKMDVTRVQEILGKTDMEQKEFISWMQNNYNPEFWELIIKAGNNETGKSKT